MRLAKALVLATMLSTALPAVAADEYVLMKINGTDVPSTDAQHFWEGLFPAGQAPAFDSVKPDVREKVLRAVMAERLLYSEAAKQGVDKSDRVLRELEDVKKKLVVRTYLDAKTSDLITEADLKAEYDTLVLAQKDAREVRARHILVATEQEAKDVKKKIDEGKSFEEVAKEFSKDPGSAKQGGDLGYFAKDKMVKEFADAAFAMRKGEVSAPVKSPFGFHIIKFEDSRKVSLPTFNEVREQLKAKLQEQKLNDYVATLVKNAEVKVYDEKGKEVPFNKNLPPVEKPVDKPAEKATEKPAEKKPEPAKPEPAVAEKPAEKSDKKPEKKVEKAAEKTTDKPVEKTADKKTEPEKSEKPAKAN